MSDPGRASSARKNFLVRLWTVLWRPSSRFMLATLVIFGGVWGILFWGGFNWGMEEANTLQFCTSCHEMRDNVFAELKSTIHFTNRSGVRASCPDCHVPQQVVNPPVSNDFVDIDTMLSRAAPGGRR